MIRSPRGALVWTEGLPRYRVIGMEIERQKGRILGVRGEEDLWSFRKGAEGQAGEIK